MGRPVFAISRVAGRAMTDIWQRLVTRDMPHGQLELLDRAADEIARLREDKDVRRSQECSTVIREQLDDEARSRGCGGECQPDRRGHAPAGQAGPHRAMRPLGSGTMCLANRVRKDRKSVERYCHHRRNQVYENLVARNVIINAIYRQRCICRV